MKPAIAALAAALLLVGAPLRAQDATGTTDNTATAAEPGATVQPADRPTEPKPRTKLLLDIFNELVRPRSGPAPANPAPVPVEPAGSPVATAPAPSGATAVATGAAATPTIPRDVNGQPSPAAPRPGATAQPPRAADAAPAPSDPDSQAEPAAEVPEPAAIVTPAPSAMPPPDPAKTVPIIWLLLGVVVAAAAVASALRVRESRRIGHTRAALALQPRLDLSAGACSLDDLSLAGPSLAIRARLDPPGAPGG